MEPPGVYGTISTEEHPPSTQEIQEAMQLANQAAEIIERAYEALLTRYVLAYFPMGPRRLLQIILGKIDNSNPARNKAAKARQGQIQPKRRNLQDWTRRTAGKATPRETSRMDNSWQLPGD